MHYTLTVEELVFTQALAYEHLHTAVLYTLEGVGLSPSKTKVLV